MPSTAKLVTLVATAGAAAYVLVTRRAPSRLTPVAAPAAVGPAATVTVEVAGAPSASPTPSADPTPTPTASSTPAASAGPGTDEPATGAAPGVETAGSGAGAGAGTAPGAAPTAAGEHEAFALPPDPSGVDIAVELLEERHPGV